MYYPGQIFRNEIKCVHICFIVCLITEVLVHKLACILTCLLSCCSLALLIKMTTILTCQEVYKKLLPASFLNPEIQNLLSLGYPATLEWTETENKKQQVFYSLVCNYEALLFLQWKHMAKALWRWQRQTTLGTTSINSLLSYSRDSFCSGKWKK